LISLTEGFGFVVTFLRYAVNLFTK
jgi:hypothetical protein